MVLESIYRGDYKDKLQVLYNTTKTWTSSDDESAFFFEEMGVADDDDVLLESVV